MLVPNNTRFQPPIPKSIIVNEGRGARIDFKKDKNYRIRFINMAALSGAMIHFNSHTMKVIMSDAAMIKEENVDQLKIAAAQRYDFILQAGSSDDTNYPFLIALDINRDFHNPALGALQWPFNYTGYLVSDASKATEDVDVVHKFDPADDSRWAPFDSARW